jgi:hypothetical protein
MGMGWPTASPANNDLAFGGLYYVFNYPTIGCLLLVPSTIMGCLVTFISVRVTPACIQQNRWTSSRGRVTMFLGLLCMAGAEAGLELYHNLAL